MATNAAVLRTEEERVLQALRDAANKVNGAGGEMTIDFSAIRRLDASLAGALEELADRADAGAVKVRLEGVNVELYKALRLLKLASRFSFAS